MLRPCRWSRVALVTLFFLIGLNVLRPDIIVFFSAALAVGIGTYFAWRLSRAILAPSKPQWRLVNVSDRGARMLVGFAVALALVNAIDFALEDVSRELDAPVVLTIGKSLIGSVLIGAMLFALSFVRPIRPEAEGGPTGLAAADPDPAALHRRRPHRHGRLRLYGACPLHRQPADLFGRHSRHDVYRAVVRKLQGIARRGTAAGGVRRKPRSAANWRNASRSMRSGLDQIGLAVGMVVYLLVILFGLPLVLMQWGFQIHDIEGWRSGC